MADKPLDAIIFKYVSPGVLISRVCGVANIQFWRERGWHVLIAEDQVRYADWYEAMREEIKKWRKGE